MFCIIGVQDLKLIDIFKKLMNNYSQKLFLYKVSVYAFWNINFCLQSYFFWFPYFWKILNFNFRELSHIFTIKSNKMIL